MQPSQVDQNGFSEQQIQFYMNQALQQAKKAYEIGQVPVGCVFVSRVQNELQGKDKNVINNNNKDNDNGNDNKDNGNGKDNGNDKYKFQLKYKIVARSHNLTNVYKNATRHCEINCIDYMLTITEQKSQQQDQNNIQNNIQITAKNNIQNTTQNTTKNQSQKLQINPSLTIKLSRHQLSNLYLFVSVQPCIMCTYALNLFKIKFVYFGQFNDKFGGCGSVMGRNNFKFRGGVKPDESIKLIKEFYQRGNLRVDEDKRNRRRKKVKNNQEGEDKEIDKGKVQENQLKKNF